MSTAVNNYRDLSDLKTSHLKGALEARGERKGGDNKRCLVNRLKNSYVKEEGWQKVVETEKQGIFWWNPTIEKGEWRLPESANETEGANETEDAPEPLGTVKGPWMKVAQSGADGEGELWKNKLTGKLRTDSPDYGSEISLKAAGRIPTHLLKHLKKTGRIPPCVAPTVPEVKLAKRKAEIAAMGPTHKKGKFDGKEKQALLDALGKAPPSLGAHNKGYWLEVAEHLPGRTKVQVQSHWKNAIRNKVLVYIGTHQGATVADALRDISWNSYINT